MRDSATVPMSSAHDATPTGMRYARRSAALRTEHLPFRVRLAQSPADLARAIGVRHAAYARHLPPALCEAMRQPEPLDLEGRSLILLAESRADGSALGTLRIQMNTRQPLLLESAVALPDWMQGRRLAEATRLAVTASVTGQLVKTTLVKAAYELCLARGVDFMVIAARSPADRLYERLLFRDVFPDGRRVPLEYAFQLPHRVLFSDIQMAKNQWEAAQHPLLEFMAYTRHPDICLH